MIVPLSLGFSSHFECCRQLLFDTYAENWFSSYGRIPSALFSFDVRVRNTIHIGHSSSRNKTAHTTRLHRWFQKDRPHLFQCIRYSDFTPQRWDMRIPKLDSTRLVFAFERNQQRGKCLGDTLASRPTQWTLHFKKTAYNWLNFCSSLPPCFDQNGNPLEHTKFGAVFFDSQRDRDIAFTMLNGKLQFTYWMAVGDDFDVTKWMFTDLPLHPGDLPKTQADELAALAHELESAVKNAVSFKVNAGRKVGNYNLAKCRDVTDKSDHILAQVFGFDGIWDDIELLYAESVKTNFEVEE